MSHLQLSIDAIKIGDRIRKDMGDIEGLAQSIAELGLLHPVVVGMDHSLIAGARRLEAVKSLGWAAVPVRILDMENIILGEHAENECRKDFTPSERVAIGREIERLIGNRQGERTDKREADDEPLQNFAEVQKGQTTREIAAEIAGFGNPETYRQAKIIVDHGAPELVEAMDKGDVSISVAVQVAKLSADEQKVVVAQGPAAARAEAKELKTAAKKPVSQDDPADTTTTTETASINLTNETPDAENETLELGEALKHAAENGGDIIKTIVAFVSDNDSLVKELFAHSLELFIERYGDQKMRDEYAALKERRPKLFPNPFGKEKSKPAHKPKTGNTKNACAKKPGVCAPGLSS